MVIIKLISRPMKKSLHMVLALAAALLCCGCAKDTVREVEVSFFVSSGLPEVKSAGDASQADQLIVRAYDSADRYLDYIPFTVTRSGNGFSVKGTFVRGEEYTLLFFAQKSGTYTVETDGMLVVEDYGAVSDESRDAFYAVEEVVADDRLAASGLSVTLKRLFALLQFTSSQEDKAHSDAAGLTADAWCRVELDRVPDRVNLLSGEVQGSVRTTLGAGRCGQDVAFAFILAGAAESRIDATVEVVSGAFSSTRIVTDIPVRRNCRTTVKGDYFTTEGTLEISLSD